MIRVSRIAYDWTDFTSIVVSLRDTLTNVVTGATDLER